MLLILRFICLFLSLLLASNSNAKGKTIDIVPGDNRQFYIPAEEVWGDISSDDIDSRIKKYMRVAPTGLVIRKVPHSLLLVSWRAPILMQGMTTKIGNLKIKIATVEPIYTKIDGRNIKLLDEDCFSKIESVHLVLNKGNNKHLKKLQFYKVTSEFTNNELLVPKSISRLSCIFTANLGFKGNNSYKIIEPKLGSSVIDVSLFSAVSPFEQLLEFEGNGSQNILSNWVSNRNNPSLIDINTDSNLFFIGHF